MSHANPVVDPVVIDNINNILFGVSGTTLKKGNLEAELEKAIEKVQELLILKHKDTLHIAGIDGASLGSLKKEYPFFSTDITFSSANEMVVNINKFPYYILAGNSQNSARNNGIFAVTAPFYDMKLVTNLIGGYFFTNVTNDSLLETNMIDSFNLADANLTALLNEKRKIPVKLPYEFHGNVYCHPHVSNAVRSFNSFCYGTNPFISSLQKRNIKIPGNLISALYHMLLWIRSVNVQDNYNTNGAPIIKDLIENQYRIVNQHKKSFTSTFYEAKRIVEDIFASDKEDSDTAVLVSKKGDVLYNSYIELMNNFIFSFIQELKDRGVISLEIPKDRDKDKLPKLLFEAFLALKDRQEAYLLKCLLTASTTTLSSGSYADMFGGLLYLIVFTYSNLLYGWMKVENSSHKSSTINIVEFSAKYPLTRDLLSTYKNHGLTSKNYVRAILDADQALVDIYPSAKSTLIETPAKK